MSEIMTTKKTAYEMVHGLINMTVAELWLTLFVIVGSGFIVFYALYKVAAYEH